MSAKQELILNRFTRLSKQDDRRASKLGINFAVLIPNHSWIVVIKAWNIVYVSCSIYFKSTTSFM